MRFLGTALIVLALLFSSGGVAYTQAGSEAAVNVQLEVQGQCKLTDPTRQEARVVDLSQLEKHAPQGFVPLNGQGYNYGDPGVWRPEVPNRTSTPPPGVPASPQR